MENNEKGEIDLENNEELEEADIYADLENNIENAKNQINQAKNNKYEEQENLQEEQEEQENENENENENSLEDPNNNNEDDEDDRLTYTLITLDLGELIHIFEENNISFVDMLLLSKDDLKELQLKLYQRNRIHNFSVLFSKYAKNYSISEISDFFGFNQKFIFNSSIYDRVIMSQNQSDVWNNNENNENLNENNKEEMNEEYNEENYNENVEEGNANININTNKEKYDFENINYSQYMNYMNKENSNINNNTNNTNNTNNQAYNMQRVKPINNNTNYNDIKYNTFNNNNYNNNYYLSTDWKENNKINQAPNIMTTDLKEARSITNKRVKPLISKGINNSKINQIKNSDKKEKPILEPNNNIINNNQLKEKKSKIIVNKKKPAKSQTNVNVTSNINNNLLEPINPNINNNNNTNLNNTNKFSSNKKKSSNKINAVINKYLEIKQDADEFLEKLNKKKIDSQNKYNKYNILIKKKNIINTKVIEPNNNLNVVNSYKNIGSNNSTQKKIGHKPMTKSSKIDEFNKLIQNYGKQNTNQESDLNQDIFLEYQKMNNQIGELEKINLDFNSKNHLNQIKKYIDEKGDNINLDDISKINSELIKMIEIIEKKEKLKQTLENYNLKIEQNKQLLNELNELDDNEQNESNENLENKINNANYENQINYNNFKNMNNFNVNNQLLDEVEEEFENEMPKRK